MSKRILLKLSGEAMAGQQGFGIDPATVLLMAKEIKQVVDNKYEISVVVGGGNIWRGQAAEGLGMDRSQADYMGMTATVMNGLALQDSLESIGCSARVLTSLHVAQVAEPYIRRKAIRHMEKGRVVILAGGTGMPYFTTDTNSMVKAAELNCNAVLMAKNGTEGVYDSDPNKDPSAKLFSDLTYLELLEKELKVMDLTAATMAKENDLETFVFNLNTPGNILKVVNGEKIGTKITN
ncbi:MAG: UMP kinase [Spiroplasma sp.]|nr:UMP kinase [Mycoplasmatales bacterium]